MPKRHFTIVLLICVITACNSANLTPIEASRTVNAIDASLRTDKDRALDDSRKPSQLLAFLSLRPGDKVAEINAGAGYNARLISTVVGSEGKVYATNAEFVLKLFEGLNKRLIESVKSASNIAVSRQPDNRIVLPEAVDIAILNNNYHDLYWQKINTKMFNHSVYDALRPGGYFIIGDHRAPQGSGHKHVATLHRIDPELVIADMEQAGFELVDSANFLANNEDSLVLPVFNPSVRGKTDRFILKFKKPELP